MTFDDDFIQLNLTGYKGKLRQFCTQVGIDWPPPEFIRIDGGQFSAPVYRRTSMSEITDVQRAEMTRVCRGAEYVHDHDEPISEAVSEAH